MVDGNSESARAIIGLGANIEPRLDYIQRAVARLREIDGARVIAISSIYESAPWGGVDQPEFLNAAALAEVSLEPLELLDALQLIERDLGRDRSPDAQRWGPRTIDLDILLFGNRVIDHPRLTVPHAHLLERAFALRPLLDVEPDAIDPRDGVALSRRFNEIDQTNVSVWRNQ